MPKILFNATDEEKQLWVEAAGKEAVTLSEWIRRACAGRLAGGGDVFAGAPTERGAGPEGNEGRTSSPPASAPERDEAMLRVMRHNEAQLDRAFKPDFKKERKKK